MTDFHQGSFTLPGEAGYEALTLELAQKWGADVERDSDGTRLSPEILNAGYQVYSTLCVIREHNAFLEAHPHAQQQVFLGSQPVTAMGSEADIPLLDGYFREQFELNTDALRYWQVYDRTTNAEVPRERWRFIAPGSVRVQGCEPFHSYTASFLCWRVWEEINMYNHTTNHWQSPHLHQLDPRNPEAWEYLLGWLDRWLDDHPHTDVVRFTSLFYNFALTWGESGLNRVRFND